MLSSVLSGCATTNYVSGTLESNGVSINESEFAIQTKDHVAFRQFIIVRNEKLGFPIYVYRASEAEYSALWMKCTHQGSELQAAGDHLYCTSHGSEFNSKGTVTHGPAAQSLRSFPVSVQGDKILIDLS